MTTANDTIDWQTARPKFVAIMHQIESMGYEFGVPLIDDELTGVYEALDNLISMLHTYEQWAWSYDNGRCIRWERCFYCGAVVTELDNHYRDSWAGYGECGGCAAIHGHVQDIEDARTVRAAFS
jgi:hypothetical protein